MNVIINDDAGMPSWGIKINMSRFSPVHQAHLPEGYPSWAKPGNVFRWQHYGVVVWDNDLQCMEVVTFTDAVKLLEHLRATDAWKSDGIAIAHEISSMKQPEQPPAPRRRNKRARSTAHLPADNAELVTRTKEQI